MRKNIEMTVGHHNSDKKWTGRQNEGHLHLSITAVGWNMPLVAMKKEMERLTVETIIQVIIVTVIIGVMT